MKKVRTILIIFISAVALSGCAMTRSSQPIPVSVQELLPDVDYSIPNKSPAFSNIASDGKRLFSLGDVGNEYGIISMDMKEKDKTLIVEEPDMLGTWLLKDGWLYYSAEDGIYKINSKGEEKSKILSATTGYPDVIMVEDGWIYYTQMSNAGNDTLYRTKDDTQERLADNFLDGVLYKGSLYCLILDKNDNCILMKRDLANKKSEKVLALEISEVLAVVNDALYYTDENGCICLYDLKTKKTEKLLNADGCFYVVQFHNYLVCLDMSEDITEYDMNDYPEYRLLLFNMDTRRTFIAEGMQYQDSIEMSADEDSIYLFDSFSGQLDRFYFDNSGLMSETINLG